MLETELKFIEAMFRHPPSTGSSLLVEYGLRLVGEVRRLQTTPLESALIAALPVPPPRDGMQPVGEVDVSSFLSAVRDTELVPDSKPTPDMRKRGKNAK